MKILIVNKFLYPNGGSETYIFKLGEQLQNMGHEVQYFGMEHEGRLVGNHAESYTRDMDFHTTSKLQKLWYPLQIIYSTDARKKIRSVLDDFQPDIVHLNNFNYQLTPSIILETVKYRKQTGHKVRILFTAHDYQLICPNHMLHDGSGNCEKCIDGAFFHCTKGKCIHGSTAKSMIGTAEGYFYKWKKTYKYIDRIICPTDFLKQKFNHNPMFASKTITMHNFIDLPEQRKTEKQDYVLYFGRYSKEKGIETLVKACRQLPNIPFLFAGKGPLEELVNSVPNIQNRGFLSGRELTDLIQKARFSICPSEVYENCPFSVMESLNYGTPVLGANIGGIPELIKNGKTGELFESGNVEELKEKISHLWEDSATLQSYTEQCDSKQFDTAKEYCEKLLKVIEEI